MKGVYLVGCIETKEKKLLKSVNAIKKGVSDVCRVTKLNIVGEKFHVFENPKGITYCFILSQSHFIIHTWPEEYKIFFDIFTCNKDLNEKKIVDALSKEFKGNTKKIRKMVYK